jgi:TfoX/Sxy family transcriptional regulator of competence genes
VRIETAKGFRPMTTHADRISQIQQAAAIRRMFGQQAVYRVVGTEHQIVVNGVVYVGVTLDEALERAKEGQGNDA